MFIYLFILTLGSDNNRAERTSIPFGNTEADSCKNGNKITIEVLFS